MSAGAAAAPGTLRSREEIASLLTVRSMGLAAGALFAFPAPPAGAAERARVGASEGSLVGVSSSSSKSASKGLKMTRPAASPGRGHSVARILAIT